MREMATGEELEDDDDLATRTDVLVPSIPGPKKKGSCSARVVEEYRKEKATAAKEAALKARVVSRSWSSRRTRYQRRCHYLAGGPSDRAQDCSAVFQRRLALQYLTR